MVLGWHPQGTLIVVRAIQFGTGQRRTGQSPGVVVLITVGHGTEVVVRMGGRVVTPMLILVWVLVEDVVLLVVVLIGGRRVRDELVVVGHANALVRKLMSHPPYGQSASQGAMRVAVGIVAGQPQGFLIVVTKLQSL